MNYYRNWPEHPVSDAINLYYQIELGCYLHQLFWTEVTRSDAVEMLLHHFITISLLIISYLTNYTRFGATILLIHDVSDIFLEFAKVCNYTAKAKSHAWMRPYVDIIFAIFMIVFFISRLIIYPKHIMYSIITEGIEYFGCEFGGCYVWIGLLGALQLLHIFWFYLIARMAYGLIFVGSIEKDVRSDDEGDDMLEMDGPPALPADQSSSSSGTGRSSIDKQEVEGRNSLFSCCIYMYF